MAWRDWHARGRVPWAVITAAVAGLASWSLVSAGSGPADGSGAPSARTSRQVFRWGYANEFTSFNMNTPQGYSAGNQAVLNQVLRNFSYLGPDGKVHPDTQFGTYEKTSDDPLAVRYVFDQRAAWSDGNPLDCDDAVLAWLANSGVSGRGGFAAAGVDGYEDMTEPRCADGAKAFTVTFRKPYADWAAMFGTVGVLLPAHIVEAKAGVNDIIAVADDPTGPGSRAASAFYNTAWNLDPGRLKAEIMPSAGPYRITDWIPGESLTLQANPHWWGPPPRSDTIVIRYLQPDTQALALANGEIDAMAPPAQASVIDQLRSAGNRVRFQITDQYTFEHIDFNLRGLFADRNLREAFARCLPRQQIIDAVVKPVAPQARILQSRLSLPFQSAYQEFKNTGGQRYTSVDLKAARRLVAATGRTTAIPVRLAWPRYPLWDHHRWQDALALIQDSCGQVGFRVLDAGSPTLFERELIDGDYDIVMFNWTGSPLMSTSHDVYTSAGEINYGKYSSPDVDRWFDQAIHELNPDRQTALLKLIDTQLWRDLATIPLYAHPAVLATSPQAHGVVYNPTQGELSWNAQDWYVND